MAKNVDFWDGIVGSGKKPSTLVKVLTATVSWLIVLVFGAVSLVSLIWVAAIVMDDTPDTQGLRVWMLYGILSVAVVGLTLKAAVKRRKVLLFHYAITPLKLGFGLNVVILLGALIVAGLYSVNVLRGDYACQPLDNQIAKIQRATVPIATDSGATGTAFAIDDESTLLTAYHVIEGAKKVYANYADGEVAIKVLEVAPEFDLALLRIAEPSADYLSLSSRYDAGDPVYVNGFPANAYHAGQASLSGGMISRYISNSDIAMNIDAKPPVGLSMIQADAAVNPGNSGGPVVGECGVVGVVSAMSDTAYLQYLGGTSEQGISYAISSEAAAHKFDLPIQK